jgi:galactokinase
MGSHTDYNDGCVLTLAIDRAVEIAGPARGDRRMSVRSTARDEPVTIDLDGLDRERLPAWARYVAGVAWALEQDGYPVPGGDLTIASDVPVGAGLSSSAALECATATWFEHASGAPLDPLRKARLCQRAENEFVGVNCGILDQYTSVFGEEGRALLLDCRELEHRTVTLPTDLTVVIGDTRAPRTLAGSEYGERRAACEAGARTMRVRALRDVTPERFAAAAATLDEVVRRRCAFIVAEQARVIAMAGAIEAGDRDAMGRLMDASFAGARDEYEIVVPAMTAMREAMRGAPGTIGARQAGAGFGGCLVALVDRARVAAHIDHVQHAYARASGREGAIFEVRPAAGAHRVSLD